MDWMKPQAALLADGWRLHLHHGPIDLIIECFGSDRARAHHQAEMRFANVLEELVAELPKLRGQTDKQIFEGEIARSMAAATSCFAENFVTPMAAVAGAVADDVLAHMIDGCVIDKAYVNNGGDVAFFLAENETISAEISSQSGGRVTLAHQDKSRGLATSGWRGRSYSFGIADSVTVLADTAAFADVAATMIANQVNLPEHPAILRTPANVLSPDSDLGERLVTTNVGELTLSDVNRALDAGVAFARECLADGRIHGAVLSIGTVSRVVGVKQNPIQSRELFVDG